MNSRPRLKIELKTSDKIMELLCLSILFFLWAIVILNFSNLPQIIPMHFNARGNADYYGNKTSILTLPFLATILYAGMTILNRYPHLYNYPNAITPDNAKQAYTTVTRMIRILKLIVISILTGAVILTMRVVFNKTDGIGAWVLPVILCMVLLPTIIFLLKLFRSK